MNEIQKRLNDDMVAAMKAKQSIRLSTIRNIRTAVKNEEIDFKTHKKGDLKEDDIITVLNRELKQTKESLESAVKAFVEATNVLIDADTFIPKATEEEKAFLAEQAHKRQQTVNELQERVMLIMEYLPQQLSEEEVVAMIKEVIEKTGASGKSGVGKVMKEISGAIKGKFEGKRASALAGELVPQE